MRHIHEMKYSLPVGYPFVFFVIILMVAILSTPSKVRGGELFQEGAYADYLPNTENGQYLANAAGCIGCHASGENLSLLSGGRKLETFIGTFYVPNITSHTNGVGGWSNADYLNAVINGIAPDGRNYYPVFPYASYVGMKPEDALDIKAYIDNLEQSDARSQRHEVSFPYNLDSTISLWKRANLILPRFQPGEETQLTRGRYLVEVVGACGECHTPRTLTYGLDAGSSLKGEKTLNGEVAPDISSSRISDLASRDVFTNGFIENGLKFSGAKLISPLKRNMTKGLSALNEPDRLAMLAYISGKEQKVVKQELSNAASCGAENAAPTIPSGDLASKADDFVGRYCRNCHGIGESAQGSFPAGDLGSIARNPAFVTPGNRNQSLLYTSVSSGRMPYGQSPSSEELEALGKWIESLERIETAQAPGRTKRSREIRYWEDEVQTALVDLSTVDERDQRFVRYFSFRNLYNGVHPCEEPAAFEKRLSLFSAGFRKLLNSVSMGANLVMPDVIQGSDDLLIKVDIRDLNWSHDQWSELAATYPYGLAPESSLKLSALSQATHTNLPIMRADWFMANASRPENYHMLLALPEYIQDLEKDMGVDVNKNIRNQKIIRSAFLEGASGVSDHNRMLERHDLPGGGYYWKSYDFDGSRGKKSLKLHPHGPADLGTLENNLVSFEYAGGEMLFTLPNGLQGYYLSEANGERIDKGPTSIVSFRQRPIGKGIDIINGRSCMSCHADGIISKRDQLREHIETSSLFSLDQMELLLRMYVDQEELDSAYQSDRDLFVSALQKIEVTEIAPDGSIKSRSGPGKAEIITWFADFYEADLDADMLAAEFEMSLEDLETAIQRVRDPSARITAIDWINQLKGGVSVPRFEVEEQYGRLIKPILNLDPLHVGEFADQSHRVPDYKSATYREDSYTQDENALKSLKLSVNVGKTNVLVGEKLSFEVSSNNECEVQILYVETDGHVEQIPNEMIGNTFLSPNHPRRIPDPSVGELVFDTPGKEETLLLKCKEGGLGDDRITAEEAVRHVKEASQPSARGLAVRLYELNKEEQTAKQEDRLTSAVHMVTFNVENPR